MLSILCFFQELLHPQEFTLLLQIPFDILRLFADFSLSLGDFPLFLFPNFLFEFLLDLFFPREHLLLALDLVRQVLNVDVGNHLLVALIWLDHESLRVMRLLRPFHYTLRLSNACGLTLLLIFAFFIIRELFFDLLGHVLNERDTILVTLEEAVVIRFISHRRMGRMLLASTRVNFTVEGHSPHLDLTSDRRDVVICNQSCVLFGFLYHLLGVTELLLLLERLWFDLLRFVRKFRRSQLESLFCSSVVFLLRYEFGRWAIVWV